MANFSTWFYVVLEITRQNIPRKVLSEIQMKKIALHFIFSKFMSTHA